MKRVLSVILVVTLLIAIAAIPVYAVQSRMITAKANLSFCGNEGDCAITITGDRNTDLIVGTMQLKHGNTIIDSWNGSAYYKLSLAGTAEVEIGYTYELQINYSVNGVQKPPIVISETND